MNEKKQYPLKKDSQYMNHDLGAQDNTLDTEMIGASEVSKVFKNTYMLLAATLIFSALTALFSMAHAVPMPHGLLMLVIFYVLLFAIHKTKDSVIGLVLTFVLTGLLGASLGPLLNQVLSLSNGGALVVQALTMTGVTFIGLSLYVTKTKKDMSFLGGFIVAGFFILLTAMIIAMFVKTTFLSLAICVGFVLFACMSILFQTSLIIRGGETNYIIATISLYVAIYNLFVSILSLTGFFSKDD